jgi:hypothetical protein
VKGVNHFETVKSFRIKRTAADVPFRVKNDKNG